MKAENLMDAIGNLHEGLLAESLPQKRRNFRPLVAVAAVAAALTITVAAGAGIFSDWLLEDKGKFDKEAYIAETMEQYPNLDPVEVEARAERKEDTYALSLSTRANYAVLEQETLNQLYRISEQGAEAFDSVSAVNEALGMDMLQTDLLTPAPASSITVEAYQMFSDDQYYDDESYLVEGLHIINAIPYGYQVFVEGIFQHPEHEKIRIMMAQEFFTTEGFSSKHNYYSDKESVHYVEKLNNRAVQFTLNEDNARAFFHSDNIAYSISVYRQYDKEITGAELETILREIIASLY